MIYTRDEVLTRMRDGRYPLSSKYDMEWIRGNALGSHCLWLMEALTQRMRIEPGMRILDIGCGKAISSIFLAKEFEAEVWAVDVNADPDDNFRRIQEAGMEKRVFPLRADAGALPFADAFFDAIVGVNSLQKFGLGETFLRDHLIRHLKPGGEFAMAVPGIYDEFPNDEIPEYLAPYVADWLEDFRTWHSPSWWRRHLEDAGNLDVRIVDAFADDEGNRIYGESILLFRFNDEDAFYNADSGRNITFVRILANRMTD